ncbi:hypothetical protein BD626DRAFT_543219 [Schizophyllum amplum]|uniref:Uncharacterized protein n=1 Tax=Schizophyllum amplum TaxID=97359 RepID=A0A550BRU9_9AGAR|nr:hypothetical protein BD626DRAFT_543219 [Auriculariopsis ampla]
MCLAVAEALEVSSTINRLNTQQYFSFISPSVFVYRSYSARLPPAEAVHVVRHRSCRDLIWPGSSDRHILRVADERRAGRRGGSLEQAYLCPNDNDGEACQRWWCVIRPRQEIEKSLMLVDALVDDGIVIRTADGDLHWRDFPDTPAALIEKNKQDKKAKKMQVEQKGKEKGRGKEKDDGTDEEADGQDQHASHDIRKKPNWKMSGVVLDADNAMRCPRV